MQWMHSIVFCGVHTFKVPTVLSFSSLLLILCFICKLLGNWTVGFLLEASAQAQAKANTADREREKELSDLSFLASLTVT